MAEQLHLPDGRKLDYAVYGPQDGFPLLWIHGTPGAYLPVPNILDACKGKKIKIITASRAGYGGSTRKKGRQIIDAVDDLKALNEHLGIERCFVGGWSGGGPHALACAARLPGCVATVCVAGVAPYDGEGLDFLAGQGQDNIDEFGAALRSEEDLQAFCAEMRGEILNATIAELIEALSGSLPPVDKEALLGSKGMGQYMIDVNHEALKINSDGWVDDDLAFIKPWGFELNEIKVPVLLYQGSEDKMVPYAHGKWLIQHLPQEKLQKNLLEGQGHISIFVGYVESMIDDLLSIAKI